MHYEERESITSSLSHTTHLLRPLLELVSNSSSPRTCVSTPHLHWEEHIFTRNARSQRLRPSTRLLSLPRTVQSSPSCAGPHRRTPLPRTPSMSACQCFGARLALHRQRSARFPQTCSPFDSSLSSANPAHTQFARKTKPRRARARFDRRWCAFDLCSPATHNALPLRRAPTTSPQSHLTPPHLTASPGRLRPRT